jgi:hypothetical protein
MRCRQPATTARLWCMERWQPSPFVLEFLMSSSGESGHLLLLLQSTRDGAAVVLYGRTRGRDPVVTIADVSFKPIGSLHLLCLHSGSTAALRSSAASSHMLAPPATLRCCCARCCAVCVQRRHDQGILAQPLPRICGPAPQRGTEGGDESAGGRDNLSQLRWAAK